MKDKIWFITGCSTGFGRELAKEVLSNGYKAVITARKLADIKNISDEYTDHAYALKLDVTDEKEVNTAVKQAERHFGKLMYW